MALSRIKREIFLLLMTGRATANLFIDFLSIKEYTHHTPFLPANGSILHLLLLNNIIFN